MNFHVMLHASTTSKLNGAAAAYSSDNQVVPTELVKSVLIVRNSYRNLPF